MLLLLCALVSAQSPVSNDFYCLRPTIARHSADGRYVACISLRVGDRAPTTPYRSSNRTLSSRCVRVQFPHRAFIRYELLMNSYADRLCCRTTALRWRFYGEERKACSAHVGETCGLARVRPTHTREQWSRKAGTLWTKPYTRHLTRVAT